MKELIPEELELATQGGGRVTILGGVEDMTGLWHSAVL